jgi:hypothetical protein
VVQPCWTQVHEAESQLSPDGHTVPLQLESVQELDVHEQVEVSQLRLLAAHWELHAFTSQLMPMEQRPLWQV